LIQFPVSLVFWYSLDLYSMRLYILIPAILLGVVYYFFPTTNSTIDAYSYATDIRYQLELFNPHHLLYNALGYLCYQLIGISTDTLLFMKALNAVSAALCLILLGFLLDKLKTSSELTSALILLTGCSFGIMRFATENETYIVPIFFSLAGTLFWVNATIFNKKAAYFFAGFLLALACLFHQIHFFWWLVIGFSVFSKNFRNSFSNVLWYFLPALIVPITYIVVFYYLTDVFSFEGLLKFVFREFYKGNVESEITLNNLILTIINSVRTWIQVHGNLIGIVNTNYILGIPALIGLGFILAGLYKLIREKKTIKYSRFLTTFLAIAITQLLFAFYSVGNAEFMVMIPFVFCLIVASLYKPDHLAIYSIAAGLFLWNFSLAILPAHIYQLTSNPILVSKIEDQPNTYFLVKDKVQIESEFVYANGKYPTNIIFPPEYCQEKYEDITICKSKLDSVLNVGGSVLTDCYANQKIMSRGSFLSGNINEEFLKNYKLQKADSIFYDLGTTYLYKITK